MLSKKVILPTLALVSVGNAIVQETAFNMTQCTGNFAEQANLLQLNCVDSQGNLIERYQRLFTRSLQQECSTIPRSEITAMPTQTASSNSTMPASNSTMPASNSTAANSTASNSTMANSTVANSTVANSTAANSTVVSNQTVSNSTNLVEVVSTDNSTVQNSTMSNATTPVSNSTTPVSNTTSVSNTTVSNMTAPSNSTSNMSAPSNSTSNMSAPSNSTSNTTAPTSGDQVNCCDFFEKGAGYEFSVCDGLGAVIIPSRIGGSRDRFWASQVPDTLLTPVLIDLGNLVENYCDARQNQTIPAGSNFWTYLNVPWNQWKQDALNDFSNIGVWLERYIQYVGAAQDYINQNQGASLPNVPSGQVANSTTDLSNVSYGQLITDYSDVYSNFISWYNTFFGPDGLVTLNVSTVMDGTVPVYEFAGNITSFENGQGADVFAMDRPDLTQWIEQIGEWISTKYGSLIVQNSCNVCHSQSSMTSNSTNSSMPANSTNSSMPSNSSNMTNGTAPVSNATSNGTAPVSNATSNGTAPVSNSTMTNGTDVSNGTAAVNGTDVNVTGNATGNQ